MKCENQMELTFPSQSRNEGFARAAVAAFAAQLFESRIQFFG